MVHKSRQVGVWLSLYIQYYPPPLTPPPPPRPITTRPVVPALPPPLLHVTPAWKSMPFIPSSPAMQRTHQALFPSSSPALLGSPATPAEVGGAGGGGWDQLTGQALRSAMPAVRPGPARVGGCPLDPGRHSYSPSPPPWFPSPSPPPPQLVLKINLSASCWTVRSRKPNQGVGWNKYQLTRVLRWSKLVNYVNILLTNKNMVIKWTWPSSFCKIQRDK
jgi:hypothetical protein